MHARRSIPLLVALAACSAELEVPADARLTCTTGSECPDGRLCVNGWCVDAASADTTPPDLAATPSVSPSVGRAGTVFTVDLSVSEPLSGPPRVTLALGVPIDLECEAQSGAAYRCSYEATGAENGGLGGVTPFDVQLTDAAGNVAVRRLAGALHLDFAPPALAAASVSPGAARLGTNLQVFFATSEPLSGVAMLRIDPPLSDGLGGTLSEVPLVASEGTLNHLFEHAVLADDPAGPVAFSVELTDLAGNGATLPVGEVSIDAVAPVVGPVTVTPARIDETGDVTVRFDVSEPAATLSVTVGGRGTECSPWSDVPPNYACTRAMAGDEVTAGAEVAQAVLVEARDAAGNLGVGSGVVVFDFRPPGVASATMTFVPAASNPLQAVTAATVGTTVRITVIADEAIDASAPMELRASAFDWATGQEVVLPFLVVPGSQTPTGATFEAVVLADPPDGFYVPRLAWSDTAGNEATTDLSDKTFIVARATPALQVDQGRVTYLRIPQGYSEANLLGAFTVPPGSYHGLAPADPLDGAATLDWRAFSFSPWDAAPGPWDAAAVRVWDRPTGWGTPVLLATVFRDAGGSWPRATIPYSTSPTVWVTALDVAGNESEPVAIENVEWVATANPRAFGTSPHVAEAVVCASGTLEPDPQATSSADGETLSGVSGDRAWGVRVAAEPVLRRRFAPSARPTARTSPALAWDAVRGKAILFGGFDASSTLLSDTWEWDGVAWKDRTPATTSAPSDVFASNVTFDGARGRVVAVVNGLFHEWDGEQWVGGRGDFGPSTSSYSHAAWDSVRDRIVVMAVAVGYPGTWEWDGIQWIRHESLPSPDVRSGASVAFDAARGRTVLYGGYDTASSTPLADLWEWDGTTWAVVPQAGDLPGPRVGHSLVPDPAGAGVLLIGGLGNSWLVQRTVHRWDGATWVDLTPPGGGDWPAAAASYGAVTDPSRGRVLLFGGYTSGETFDQTWEWDGARWEDRSAGSTPLPPSMRWGSAMAYDAERGRVVKYGGDTNMGLTPEVWEFDGFRWTDVTPAVGPAPSPRAYPSLAWDSTAQRVVLFGGAAETLLNDTWEWSGSGWTPRATSGAPSARRNAGLAYDPARGALVLFGGGASLTTTAALGDTWELTDEAGTWTWTRKADPPPPALLASGAPALCFDGSRTLLADNSWTWGWDGGAWSQLGSFEYLLEPRGPTAWDPVRRKAVSVGFDQLIEWDGASTRALVRPEHASWPSEWYWYAIAFDEARGRTVLQGGPNDLGESGTWELDADLEAGGSGPVQKREPAVQLTVGYGDAGFTFPIHEWPEQFEVTGLRVRARAGGSFGGGGTGARLLGWKRAGEGAAGWVTLDANATPASFGGALTEGALAWDASPDEVRRFFVEGDRRLAFQLRPAGRSAPADPGATVNADFLEVRVRYVKRY